MKRFKEFEWDEANRDKNWLKHQVTWGECEEVFFNLPLMFHKNPGHSQEEPRWFILGQTNLGRRLFVAFTLRQNRIRVISARDMNKKERVIYEKNNPEI